METSTNVVAELGPTNTGKTHRAIERLLAHRSAMIGLPLRLLAREVYDRITSRIGESEVALITGEEKRVPPGARYWVCTVEAMPLDLEVDFLAIDEIQLAAHRERGHVFTDRLLHARGREETRFLGADTLAPWIRANLPDIAIRRHPRMSQLRHRGASGIGGLPTRTATVAFSANEVYELAARLKHRKGGAAVVLGGLSPRTRNAQVALYQAGEVSHMVASDAIGMGLNLDIDHIAFASVRKFDGRMHRALFPSELAQIAGRAGRYQRDGTFGTLRPLDDLALPVAQRIEEHRFRPIRRIVWRNPDLNFTSVTALFESLIVAPASDAFMRIEQADDFDALRMLAARDDVMAKASSADAIRTLWEICQVPDYRKLMLRQHVALLAEIFLRRVDAKRLETDFVKRRVSRIDRIDGRIDDLTARLAAIRVWTYISHQRGWVDDEAHWRGHTRDIEERLGDALHHRLVEQFVEVKRRSSSGAASRPTVSSGDSAFAGLLKHWEAFHAEDQAAEAAWTEALIDAEHEALQLVGHGNISFRGEVVGRLLRGRTLREPQAVVDLAAHRGGPGIHKRVQRRLEAFAKDYVHATMPTLRALSGLTPSSAIRGLVYQLEQRLGVVRRHDAATQLRALHDDEREALQEAGLHIGHRHLIWQPACSDAQLAKRAWLVHLFYGLTPWPWPIGKVAVEPSVNLPPDAWAALGYMRVANRVCRIDGIEMLLERFSQPIDDLDTFLDQHDTYWGRDPTLRKRMLQALGYTRTPNGELKRRRRRRRKRPKHPNA